MQTHLERIKKDLEVLATYTSTPGFGVTRSSYSKEDKQAREYLIREMENLILKSMKMEFLLCLVVKKGQWQRHQ